MKRVAVAVAGFALGLSTPALAARPYDFDQTGRERLVLGVPGWSAGGAPNAGAVIVLRGSRSGVSRSPGFLMQGVARLPGLPQGDDAFGAWTASGDFNGDRFADLAVAAPGDEITMVIAGSTSGLRLAESGVLPAAGTLVAADFDGDGHGDLAVGEPFSIEHRNADFNEGRIRLFKGAAQGVMPTPWRTLASPRRRDYGFGSVLALGDVNRDGRPDLVEASVGSTEDSDGEGIPGHLTFCAGRRSGPTRCRELGRPFPGGPETLAVADVNGDGYGDIVGGRPVNDFVSEGDAPPGAVNVWRGSRHGPSTNPLVISQNSLGVPGHDELGDAFGAAIAARDIDQDGFADLIVGAPGEDRGRGRITIVRGAASGYSAKGNRMLQQGAAGIPGPRRAYDYFGAATAVLKLHRRGELDLVVGAPGDRSMSVIRGLGHGQIAAVQVIRPESLGLLMPPEPPDVLPGFGALVARPDASL